MTKDLLFVRIRSSTSAKSLIQADESSFKSNVINSSIQLALNSDLRVAPGAGWKAVLKLRHKTLTIQTQRFKGLRCLF